MHSIQAALECATQTPPPPWPTVCNIADLEGYCKTFEKLLWEERAQILLIYQTYSQYNLPVSVPTPSETSSDRHVEELTAISNIPGIADVRPTLGTGDIVLYRPMRHVSLPTRLKKNKR